ncbi:MAG: hypothetical protein HYS27_03075 [Deltaproteobacteria bacterium]|nr:hypothetical protein [Deltaproteobacteria bacterium]
MRALLVVLVAASPALADEGELYLGGEVGVEAAALRHPLAQGGEWLLLVPPNALIARAGLGARFGVTNEVHPSVGLEVGAARNVTTTGVLLGGAPAQVVTGTYLELGTPIGVGWRIDTGFDVSAVLGVEVAPHVAWWAMGAAIAAAAPEHSGPSRVLPIGVADVVRLGGSVRLRAAVELRVFDVVAVQLAPYVGVGWDGAPTSRVGIAVQAMWVPSAGSSWR